MFPINIDLKIVRMLINSEIYRLPITYNITIAQSTPTGTNIFDVENEKSIPNTDGFL